jgi:hypothetical protein
MTALLAEAADGAQFLLTSALALAAIVASSRVLWGLSLRQGVIASVLFALVAILTVWLPPLPANILSPAVLAVCGLLLALGFDWPMGIRGAAAAAGAITAGISGGIQTATWAEAAGAVLVLLLLVFALLQPARFVPSSQPALKLARRMAGAWIAAVGVLMLVLTVRGVNLGG